MDKLTSRAVIGMFYETLQQDTGVAWVNALSNYFESDQPSEEYPWLGMVPTLREWIGGRQAKSLAQFGITIPNLHFEATIEILVRLMRRDKTGQIRVRIGELVERSQTHWAQLLSTLIVAGESQVCYDGQYFFDTDHAEGDSGTQSNKITTDISELPAQVHGSTTRPSPEEFQQAVNRSINQLGSFKDDKGEPMNEGASNFLVMVPFGLRDIAQTALSMPRGTSPAELAIVDNFKVSLATNIRLPWTTKFAVFRTDGRVRPFIRQEETGVQLKAKAEGSEFEFDNDAHQYGIDTWRNAGYGRWQYAVLNELT